MVSSIITSVCSEVTEEMLFEREVRKFAKGHRASEYWLYTSIKELTPEFMGLTTSVTALSLVNVMTAIKKILFFS